MVPLPPRPAHPLGSEIKKIEDVNHRLERANLKLRWPLKLLLIPLMMCSRVGVGATGGSTLSGLSANTLGP